MLRTGQMLRNTTSTVNATTRAENQTGGSASAGAFGSGSNAAAAEWSIALNARMIVSQFSHAKFPESTSHNWVTMMIAPATLATGCGAHNPNGTSSWAKWLPATSIRCSGLGRWWKNQLSGPGIGCVSWWEY